MTDVFIHNGKYTTLGEFNGSHCRMFSNGPDGYGEISVDHGLQSSYKIEEGVGFNQLADTLIRYTPIEQSYTKHATADFYRQQKIREKEAKEAFANIEKRRLELACQQDLERHLKIALQKEEERKQKEERKRKWYSQAEKELKREISRELRKLRKDAPKAFVERLIYFQNLKPKGVITSEILEAELTRIIESKEKIEAREAREAREEREAIAERARQASADERHRNKIKEKNKHYEIAERSLAGKNLEMFKQLYELTNRNVYSAIRRYLLFVSYDQENGGAYLDNMMDNIAPVLRQCGKILDHYIAELEAILKLPDSRFYSLYRSEFGEGRMYRAYKRNECTTSDYIVYSDKLGLKGPTIKMRLDRNSQPVKGWTSEAIITVKDADKLLCLVG